MYAPQEIPSSSVEDLARVLTSELQRIADALSNPEFDTMNLVEKNVALDKPRDGDTVNADGTNWNPGSGKGIYYFNGTSYVKLG